MTESVAMGRRIAVKATAHPTAMPLVCQSYMCDLTSLLIQRSYVWPIQRWRGDDQVWDEPLLLVLRVVWSQ